MATITANWDNDRAIRALRQMGRDASDLSPAMRRIGEYYTGVIDDRFRDERDPSGNRWASLSPRYLERKRRQSTTIDKILQRSGGMRQGINYQLISSTAVRVGSDKEYAKYHEFGTRKMPARRFLEPNRRDRDEFALIVIEHLRGS